MDVIPGPDLPVAFAAGALSFVSPCVLPLVPGYLSVVTAGASDDGRLAALRPSLLFVASFSAVFVALGLTASALGSLLRDHQDFLTAISGVFLVLLGSLMIATLISDSVSRSWRSGRLVELAGTRGGPVVAGFAFAIAWTPCIGPTLGAVLTLAATSTDNAYSALMLATYSLGLAVPFLLASLFFTNTMKAMRVLQRHYRAMMAVGGAVVVAMGVLILTGGITALNVWAQRLTTDLGLTL